MQRKQEEGRYKDQRYGGKDRYNDKDGGRDNRDRNYKDGNRRDNKKGGDLPQPQKYQKKQQTDPGRDNKNEKFNEKGGNKMKKGQSEKEREIVPIDEDEMNEIIKKNFEEFVLKIENSIAEQDIENDEEDKNQKKKEERFDVYPYKRLQRENGKQGSQMFYSLLSGVFDEDIQRVEKYFFKYIQILYD